MKHIHLHPAVILTSVIFWAVLVVIIYAAVMLYFFGKMFSANDTVHVNEAVGTVVILRINRHIYRRKVKPFVIKNKPFAKL